MQRFWLTATKLGLQFQPEMTPLIFASYMRRGIEFTRTPRSLENARQLTGQLESLIGAAALDGAVYMGRSIWGGWGSGQRRRPGRCGCRWIN